VTHAGGKELAEPLVVRPTSETLFGALMSKWVNSYRDLPLLLNQWCNVVRWELRPRLFLRTSEFLWQEGHCAHVSEEDAHAYALQIHLNVYRDFLENVLGIPIVVGAKTSRERFAGAINTMTCEAMMGDGKALQMATSHELGQSFAKVFNITFSDAGGRQQTCWTTSWGCSTRMLGGLIMAHGDGNGLMVPPKLAPTQVVVLLVKEDELASAEADRLTAALTAAGIRVRLDLRTDTSFGRRVTNWELKGIPVRIEIGPRDLAAGNVSVTRRDDKEKWTIATSAVVERVDAILSDIQAAMLEKKRAELQSRTVDTTSMAEAREAARSGFARIPWDALGDDGERELNEDAVSVRCLQTEDGEVPERKMSTGLVALVGRSY
jgi:prolyl-tRNA synthetase